MCVVCTASLQNLTLKVEPSLYLYVVVKSICLFTNLIIKDVTDFPISPSEARLLLITVNRHSYAP